MFNPPLTNQQAARLWIKYRKHVDALSPRTVPTPTRFPLSEEDKLAAKRFLSHFKGSPQVLDMIRVDPFDLVAHQRWVVTDRSKEYAKTMCTPEGWVQECLSPWNCSEPQLSLKYEPNKVAVEVPHMEYRFIYEPPHPARRRSFWDIRSWLNQSPKGGFRIQELARHPSVTEFGGRMMLAAGYHRTYAWASSFSSDSSEPEISGSINAPEAIARSLLVALTTDGADRVSPDSPNQGLRATLCGPCPPLLRDFFDEDLAMPISFLKLRFELHIEASIVPFLDV